MRALRALPAGAALCVCSFALAQPHTLVTDAQRRHAAMMILVFVLVGMLLTYALLWVLRQKGLLKEENPDGPLQQLEREIARRSDEIEK